MSSSDKLTIKGALCDFVDEMLMRRQRSSLADFLLTKQTLCFHDLKGQRSLYCFA